MKSGRLMFALVMLVALTATAWSQHVAKDKADNGPDAAAGQRAAVDPATGKLRQPSAEEVRELLQGLAPFVNQSVEGLQAKRLEDGTLRVDLDGRFENASLAKINPDGTLSLQCVSTTREAEAFLTNQIPAKNTPAESASTQPLEEK